MRHCTCSINSNGFLSFEAGGGGTTSAAYTPTALPAAAAPNNLIAGWWRDLFPQNGGIYYQTLGTAPNRRFVVLFNAINSGGPNTFEFKLFEGSNRAEIHYQSIVASGTTTIGIENAAGTVGRQYYSSTGVPPLAAPFAVRFLPPTVVTSVADSGAGSLRQAITDVPANGAIVFNQSLNGQTITLGGSQLTVSKNLSIDASALPGGITISGNNASRVFNVAAGNTVTMTGLTITGGNSATADGGGIYNGGTLNLNRCTVAGNNAPGGLGGGIFNDFGATLNTTYCSVANNSAISGGAGGGVFAWATATLIQVKSAR